MELSHFGQLHEYQASQEPISAYLEQVALFYQVNNIVEGKQMAAFLSVVAAMMYALLRNLLAEPVGLSGKRILFFLLCMPA